MFYYSIFMNPVRIARLTLIFILAGFSNCLLLSAAASGSDSASGGADGLSLALLALLQPASPVAGEADADTTTSPECSSLTSATSFPLSGTSDTGDGSASNPYWICTTSQLQILSLTPSLWSSSFALKSDLDMSSVPNHTPIGNSTTHFTGNFDGEGHTITSLWAVYVGSDDVGLFGVVNGSTIRNFTLPAPTITGKDRVGAVAAYGIGSTFESISVTLTPGAVSSQSDGGGIVGRLISSTISDCDRRGNVICTTNNCGGLAGYANLSTIQRSSANHHPHGGASNVGGLIGQCISCTLEDSFMIGGPVSGDTNVGGLIGTVSGGTVSRNYVVSNVSGTANEGAAAGNVAGATTWSRNYYNSSYTGPTAGAGAAPGGTEVEGYSTTTLRVEGTYVGWDFTNVWNPPTSGTYPTLR